MNSKIAFVLQGGGALGAYQAGACHALIEKGIEPDWLIGTSIGALNAALIAGNKPENRIEALNNFWKTISSDENILEQMQKINFFMNGSIKNPYTSLDANNTLLKGQKGFFKPKANALNMVMKISNQNLEDLSYYETSELKETLLKYVDFDLINNGNVRVSIGVVKVSTGEFMYFDNQEEILTPEHFMASGALPPGFPAIKIKEEYYWDGGISDNSAIHKMIQQPLKEDWTAYQIDLWKNEHDLPQSFDQLTQRVRDIQFASKNKQIDTYLQQRTEDIKNLKLLLNDVPDSLHKTSHYKKLLKVSNEGKVNIQRIVYQGVENEKQEKTFQFGITAIKEHWENGYQDVMKNFFTLPIVKNE